MSNYQFLMTKHACMESGRLFLRPITMSDAADMFDYTSDEETTRFLYEPHTELQQTEKMIGNYFMKEPIGKYALVLKETGKMIGAIIGSVITPIILQKFNYTKLNKLLTPVLGLLIIYFGLKMLF